MKKDKRKRSRVLWDGLKLFSRVWRRITALVFAVLLLFSSVSVGVLVPETEVKAIAGVDDTAVLVEFLEMIIALASSAGGISNQEMFTSADAAGITSWADARGYVHSSFSGNSDFCNLFNFNTKRMIQFECTIAAGIAMGGYVFQREFLNKLWSMYDPREDGWESGKWGDFWDNLDDLGKISFVDDLNEAIKASGLAGFSPPDPDYDDNEDEPEEDNDDGEKYKSHYKEGGKLIDEDGNLLVLETGAVNAAFTTATFQAVYYLAKKLKLQEQKERLDPETETDSCDYSYEWWLDHFDGNISPFLSVHSQALSSESRYQDLYFGFSAAPFWGASTISTFSGYYFYPLLYTVDGKPYFSCATDYAGSFPSNAHNKFIARYYKDEFGTMGSNVSYRNLTEYGADFVVYDYIDVDYDLVDYLILNRYKFPGDNVIVDAPYIIDCETRDNVDKFQACIQSGDYTFDEIIQYMADGWKGDKKKSWQSVEDKGETAKKVMESDEGKKYKTTGKKITKDGQKIDGEGVTFSSLVEGMLATEHAMEGSVTSPKTGIDDLLGGQVTLPEPIGFPSPEDYPDGVFYLPNAQLPPSPDTPDISPTPTPGPTPTPEPGIVPSIPGTDTDIQWYERFPFCIPWDLYNGVSSLKANTKVPKFDIPFKIKRLSIDEKITIDFSEYENLAVICRWFFRVLFGIGLVMVSRPIIKG